MSSERLDPSPPSSLAIGVPTFQRRDRLRTLLPPLLDQADALLESDLGVAEVRIIVVDNDPAESARSIVDEHTDRVEYHVEPEPGISSARNRILDVAASADHLVFIDDDETPSPHWLVGLVRLQAETRAAAVAGRVVSVPDGDVHPFVEAGGFLDRAHRAGTPTGSRITRAATNNLLVDLRFVRRIGLRFDPRFGLTGGEDSLFTSLLVRAGGLMVWCHEAVVHDHVSAERMTPHYMLSRAKAMASAGVHVELTLRSSIAQRATFRAHHVSRELARAVHAVALVVRGHLGGSLSHRARGRRALARARGALTALFGHRVHHYAPASAVTVPPRASRPTT